MEFSIRVNGIQACFYNTTLASIIFGVNEKQTQGREAENAISSPKIRVQLF